MGVLALTRTTYEEDDVSNHAIRNCEAGIRNVILLSPHPPPTMYIRQSKGWLVWRKNIKDHNKSARLLWETRPFISSSRFGEQLLMAAKSPGHDIRIIRQGTISLKGFLSKAPEHKSINSVKPNLEIPNITAQG